MIPLAEHFMTRAAEAAGIPVPRLAAQAITALNAHAWPGNVRELKNVIERAVLFCDGSPVIECEHLPAGIRGRANAPSSLRAALPDASLKSDVEEFEKKRIMSALERCNGNQTRAASLLGISRRTLVSRLSEYGLPRPRK